MNTNALWNSPSGNGKNEPLAQLLRPKLIEEVRGQYDILKEGSILKKAIENDDLFSCIFFGPPGCGKTTVGKIIGNRTSKKFISFSAAKFPMSKLKPLLDEATVRFEKFRERTVLFVDEIHRFNKLQQDVLLPYIESGEVILIGATTENPSFELNPALLSRCKMFVFKQLGPGALKSILDKSLDYINKSNAQPIKLHDETVNLLVDWSGGDARTLINYIEIIENYANDKTDVNIDTELAEEILNRSYVKFSKSGEEHYNFISAFIKSMRGSDPDAAIYYLARMLEAGEDPLYVARRIVRFASEDIGLADPNAMSVAVAAFQASKFIGMPECTTSLAEAAVYMAVSPKSNRIYLAYKKAATEVQRHPDRPIPLKLRNAVTKLMKDMGYGKEYKYAHDESDAFVLESYLPEDLENIIFYRPSSFGKESRVKDKLETIWKRTYEDRKDE
ncbi:MAG TPA: replication-associated recombination protein A [Thermotogota bacterium]|nr:replication-associated recombination protein A [Thermotogota bacterium]HPJ89440.1 replication-associated recombination protein A [Thermotogota bacterium]HPR95265.1 replication-associated recombination protein A [Thermotogota bacterium]